MFRRFKTLPLVLALASVTIFATGCGSGNARLRIVQAIPDVPSGQPLDIYLDGNKAGSAVGYEGLTPGSGYSSVSSGSLHLQVYLSGQIVGPYFDGNLSLSSGTDYTVVLTGSVTSNTVVAPLFTDNNLPPTSATNFELRVINASPSWSTFFGGVDVYLVAPNTTFTCVSPSVSNLKYEGFSPYVTAPAGTYDVIGTPAGSCGADINQTISFNPGSIHTLVLVDAPGSGLSFTPLLLSDLGN